MNKRAESTKAKIIQAAMDCYRDYGVQRSSMDIIAERAGTTKPTMYAHFGSKNKLVDVVVETLSDQMPSEEYFSYDPNKEVVAQLIGIFEKHFELTMSRNQVLLYRALMVEFIERDEELPNYDNSKKELLLRKWISDANEAGVISVEDIETSTNNLFAIISGRFSYPIIIGIKHFSKKALKEELNKSITTFLRPLLK